MKHRAGVYFLRLSGYRIARELTRASALIAFACVGLYLYNILQAPLAACQRAGYRATLAGFALLNSDSFIQLLVMTGAVTIYCHVPFRDELYPQLLLRSGKPAWMLANVASIVVIAAAYVLFLLLVYAATMAGVLEPSTRWGEAWTRFARPGSTPVLAGMSRDVVANLRGPDAFGMSVGLLFGCVAFIGLVMYAGNCLPLRSAGLYIACAMLLMDLLIWNVMPDSWRTVSPISAAMVSFYTGAGALSRRSPVWLYGGGAAVCALVIWLLEYRLVRSRKPHV